MAYWSPFGPIRRNGGESPYLPNCGQMNTCPFVHTLQARINQDKQLEQRADALQLEENRLKKEKNTIQEEKQRLQRQRKALGEQEARLSKQQNQLTLLQFSLSRREQSLTERENQYLRDRGALKILEQQLASREAALAAREAALEGGEEKLKEAAETCRLERQKLEEIKHSCASGSGIGSAMQEVRTAFQDIGNELKATQQKLRNLIVSVEHSSRDGIAQLCRLHREMLFTEEPRTRLLADQLEMILQAAFEAVPLAPQPGEPYDSSCHERVNVACTGSSITRCRAQGWQWKDEILMRSVVETKERDEEK